MDLGHTPSQYFVPQNLVYKTPHVNTGDIRAYLDYTIQTKPAPITKTTSKLDNSVNIDNA